MLLEPGPRGTPGDEAVVKDQFYLFLAFNNMTASSVSIAICGCGATEEKTYIWWVLRDVPEFPACSRKHLKRSRFQKIHPTFSVDDKHFGALWHRMKKQEIAIFEDQKIIFLLSLTNRARISSVLLYLLEVAPVLDLVSNDSYRWQTVWQFVTFGIIPKSLFGSQVTISWS